jgi:hypothetical protein
VIRGEIVERADGVPLFVEELTKTGVQAGASGRGIKDAGRSGTCSIRSAGLRSTCSAAMDTRRLS